MDSYSMYSYPTYPNIGLNTIAYWLFQDFNSMNTNPY